MRYIFTLLTFFIAFNGYCQFSHKPDTVVINAHIDTLITKKKILITVDADTTYEVHWTLFKDSVTWKKGWGTQVCDLNLCYLENKDENPKAIPNYMGRGTTAWYVYMLPYGISGDSKLELVLYGDEDRTIELYRIPIDVHAFNTTNTINVKLGNDIVLYPNPSEEYFSVSNSRNVEKIKLYNMLGKEVKTFFHYNNAQHLIGDLKSGMYLVRMLDKNDKIIKTAKLNKIHTGA